MLFGYRANTLLPSINEINCSVIDVPDPVFNYKQFKGCNCFQKARQMAGNLGYTINWNLR
jgi:uracil-DNA glycosylase